MAKYQSKQYQLMSSDNITGLLLDKNISTWHTTISYIQHLPYGRSSSRSDLSTVIRENCGTCSSKHALLKSIADRNSIPNVNLILCIYKRKYIIGTYFRIHSRGTLLSGY